MNRRSILNILLALLLVCWGIATGIGPVISETGGQPPAWTNHINNIKSILEAAALVVVVIRFVPLFNRWWSNIEARKAEVSRGMGWSTEVPGPERVPTPSNMLREVWDRSWHLWESRLARISRYSFRITDTESIDLPVRYAYYANFLAFQEQRAEAGPAAGPDVVGQWSTSLAVVGPAGIGKSYSLLLLLRAHMQGVGKELRSYDGPVPVLLDLRDWKQVLLTDPRHVFETWAHRTLCSHYKLRPDTAQWLINSHQLLFFLDGLDEVDANEQAGCFAAILAYATQHRNVLFSCRPYHLEQVLSQAGSLEDWAPRFPIYEIQPVSPSVVAATIRRSIADAGLAEKAIAAVARYGLEQYVETPLLLNLYVQVYNPTTDSLLEKSRDEGHAEFTNLLWKRYEIVRSQQEMERTAQNGGLTQAQWDKLRTTLIWLARKMPASGSFFIEDIQPHHWLHDTPPLLLPWGAKSVAATAAEDLPTTAANDAADEPPAVVPPSATVSEPSISPPLLLYYFTSRMLTALLLAVAVSFIIAEPGDFLAEGILVGLCATAFVVSTGYSRRWKSATIGLEWRLRRFVPRNVMLTIFFSLLLMAICGAYEGFTVKRTAHDMRGAFSVTQSTLGILVGLISGIVFGFRKYKRQGLHDIRPLERVGLKWKDALLAGVQGGIVVGILIGCFGVLLEFFFPGATLDDWLRGYFGGTVAHEHGGAWSRAGRVFGLAFAVAGPIGFVLLGLLASLDTNRSMLQPEEKARQTRRRLNAGISNSWRNGLLGALGVLGALALVYGLLYAVHREFEPERFLRILLVGLGGSLVAFIWFGGFEVIQHLTLRFYLFVYGRLPFDFRRQLHKAQRLAYFQQSGYLTTFTQESLLQYYRQPATAPYAPLPPADLAWPWLLRGVVGTSAVATAGLLLAPLWHRYPTATNQFWHRPNELVLRVPPRAGQVVPPAQSNGAALLRLRQAGRLQVHFAGLVHLGTFLGHSGPSGREYGFLGFPLKNAYDVHPQFAHGAVLYQLPRDTAWHALVSLSNRVPGWPGTPNTVTLPKPIRAGDEVRFIVNDREWENNSGHFELSFQLRKAPVIATASAKDITQ